MQQHLMLYSPVAFFYIHNIVRFKEVLWNEVKTVLPSVNKGQRASSGSVTFNRSFSNNETDYIYCDIENSFYNNFHVSLNLHGTYLNELFQYVNKEKAKHYCTIYHISHLNHLQPL